MIVVGLTCILVFGSAILHRIAHRRPLLEKVLCGYLVGIGLTTVVLFMFDVLRVQFTVARLSLTLVLATLLILFPWLKTDNLRDQIKILFSRIGRLPRLKPMNLAWLAYTVVFYQMDVEKMGSSIAMIMKASYRRGMFVFIPLAWFYIGANAFACRMSAKLIGYMDGSD